MSYHLMTFGATNDARDLENDARLRRFGFAIDQRGLAARWIGFGRESPDEGDDQSDKRC